MTPAHVAQQSAAVVLSPAGRAPRSLPAKFCRHGAALLNLQCWLWGQDIRRAEGNLLLLYGAARVRPAADVSGCSQYSFALQSGAVLKLWGFGMYVGNAESGCYLNRYEFVPRQASGEDCWSASAFRTAPRNPPLHGVAEALHWMAEYERAVLQQYGEAWRLRAAAGGPDTSGSAMRMHEAWRSLAWDVETWLIRQHARGLAGAGMRTAVQHARPA